MTQVPASNIDGSGAETKDGLMRRGTVISWRMFMGAALLLFFGGAASCSRANTYQITPDQSTMVIGESRSFRMVDENGQTQHKVRWMVSDASAFQESEGDELHLWARRTGEYRLTGRTDFASAEASVKVVEAKDMTQGSVKWQSGKREGCATTKIIPARPGVSGADVFEQSQCADGVYLAAYNVDGVQLWRRKITDGGSSRSGGDNYESEGEHLQVKAASVCDAVQVGAEQAKVRAMLEEQHLSYREQPGSQHVWVVEQASAQCRLQFDDKLVLVKKKKVFVVE
jgi:hypothetical protein